MNSSLLSFKIGQEEHVGWVEYEKKAVVMDTDDSIPAQTYRLTSRFPRSQIFFYLVQIRVIVKRPEIFKFGG